MKRAVSGGHADLEAGVGVGNRGGGRSNGRGIY